MWNTAAYDLGEVASRACSATMSMTSSDRPARLVAFQYSGPAVGDRVVHAALVVDVPRGSDEVDEWRPELAERTDGTLHRPRLIRRSN